MCFSNVSIGISINLSSPHYSPKALPCSANGQVHRDVEFDFLQYSLLLQKWIKKKHPFSTQLKNSFFRVLLLRSEIILIREIYFLDGLMLSIFINPDLYLLPGSLPFLKIGETIYDPDFKIEKISVCQIAFAFNWDKKVKILRRIRILLSKIWFSFFKDKKEFSCLISKNGPFELIRFPLIVKDKRIRENILKKSKAKGLGIEKSYPDSIDNIGEISHMFKERNFPSAKYVATHIITLPTHNFVSINDIKLITDLM